MDAAERREAARERLRTKAAEQSKQKAVAVKEQKVIRALEKGRLESTMKDTPDGYEMVTGTMPLPAGAKPGSKLSVSLPSGEQIVVTVPPEARAGKEFTFGFHQQKRDKSLPPRHDGRMIEHTLAVPDGLKPGDVMAVLALPWGVDLELKIPDGLAPKEEFTVKIPVPEGFGKDPSVYERTIKVPPGWEPGAPVGFVLPWGETLQLRVPDDGTVGDNLMIQIPFPASYAPPWRAAHAKKMADKEAAAALEATGSGAGAGAAEPPAAPVSATA